MTASRAIQSKPEAPSQPARRQPKARPNAGCERKPTLKLERRKGEGKRTPQAIAEDEVLRKAVRKNGHLDRMIIEGMLGDRHVLMRKFAELGIAQGAVLRRAAELGLSEALLRQVKGVAADLAGDKPDAPAVPSNLGARSCLSCDRVFLSTGPGNRLCMRCRGGDAGLAQT